MKIMATRIDRVPTLSEQNLQNTQLRTNNCNHYDLYSPFNIGTNQEAQFATNKIVMAVRLNKHEHIPVDIWDTEECPILDQDRIFRNIKGEIILPIAEFFRSNDESTKQLDYFIMNAKRSYNSDEIRNHICRYLNYFEKFYDYDKELLMILYELKLVIDYNKDYKKDNFMQDVNRYIIRNKSLSSKIARFVNDNYLMRLSNNNNKTPNLQFENRHAKILYEISLMMNMYIPLATHYMYIHMIKKSEDIQDFMIELFDLCCYKYEQTHGVDIYNKIYETALSVVNKSKNPDKNLWEKNMIRGINTTTHIKTSVAEIILQIIPKYTFDKNIINFNYYSNRKSLQYKVTDIKYEFPFVSLSSSKRDQDNNSELDRHEARLVKRDEAVYLQTKVNAEQTIKKIEMMYGPFSDGEINHYKTKLTKDGQPIINSFQKQMVGYLFYKEFGDTKSIDCINQIDYIKLIIAGKRLLLKSGMIILPYIISSRVLRMATRKSINKKELIKIKSSELFDKLKAKYNNPKVEQRILEIISKISSSTFEIIEYDADKQQPGEFDGYQVPIIDAVYEELIFFICMI